MRFLTTAFALLVALTTFSTSAFAVEDTWDVSVQVSATVQSSPARITLAWPQDTNGVPSAYTIYRRAPGSTNWGSGTNIAGSSTSYVDSNVSTGTAYEYRIVKAASGYTGYGYILAGVEAPLVDSRGKVVLVVDNSIAGSLATELTQLDQDLRGDGWTVIRRDVGRNDSPASVKAVIKSVYDSDPANVKSVFLFGHVPVPYSGQLNPDGHPDHVGAWPADVYYGDMDGNWTDSSVNYTQTVNTDTADAARITNRPGDGKFDQTQIPSSVELEVGRVDLANLPGRTTWGGPATFPSELELLRKYLNKDHNFRLRRVNPTRRAILGDYFGYRGGEAFAGSGFRSFAPLVGANNIRNLNVEYNDQRGVWIQQAAANDYLLAYACGAGSYTSISGIGNSASYNGGTTPEMVSNNVRGVFNLLFGSWLGDWDHEDNILRAPLATDYGLTSAWSGRPHWYMHTMGLGGTVGSTARLTQNNNGDYQTVINSAQNQIHIALMGDPTLRLHPVAPVSNLNGATSGSTLSLSWTASNDSNVVGYHIYRASSATGSYTRLTASPITATNYTDNNATSGATYQVRAVKLETSGSGSYYNASQAAFYTVGGTNTGSTTPPPTTTPSDTSAPSVSISSPSGTVSGSSVTVSANANDNIGVTGVQFKLDGANLGAEDTSTPFTTTWNTTAASNGTHTLTAVARDAAGNIASATAVTVTVSNTTASSGGTTSGGTTSGGTTSGGSTTTPTDTTTPPTASAPAAGTVVWFDDALPAGAGASGAWNWTTSPAPFSGSKSHQTTLSSGLSEYSFNWATPLTIKTGEILFAYVYIDPSSPPSEIMFSFASDNWEHRAYWGSNTIQYGVNGTASRRPMSAIPTAGQWVRLEIPASQLGLEGQTVVGFGLSVQGGRMNLDYVGKYDPSVATTTTPSSSTSTSSSTTASPTAVVWFEDALPAGAGSSGTWNWVTSSPAPYAGTKAHQLPAATGLHEASFNWATPFSIATGESLVTHVYIDPANPPTSIMLSWVSDNWEHRAYWGADQISYGTPNTNGHRSMGAIPAAGQWVTLSVPASQVGLEGQSVQGMGFSLYGGKATFDSTGKAPAGSTTTTTPPSSGSGSTTTSGSGSTTTTTTPPSTTVTNPPSQTDPNTPSAPQLPAATDVVWFDDALPAGATGSGTNGDGWNWVTTNPTPKFGTKAHQTNIKSGVHEHSFNWGQMLNIVAGDTLYTYVYIDPANKPTEIMVSWMSDNWEHRAYWGADKIGYGTNKTASRYYVGPVPTAGQWVRLEVPAKAVGLEGSSVQGMGFSLYDGAVTWDKAGKMTAGTITDTTTSTTTTPPTSPSVPAVTETVWFDDAIPAGATGGGTAGDAWNWITTNPAAFSGTKSSQTTINSALHELSFNWAGATMAPATGEAVFAYVYIDPANVPQEIMISWFDGTWEHRAFWGADKIGYGNTGTAGRFNAGPMPAAGQWVRLEVPAKSVGLEGSTVSGLGLSLYGGRVTWDKFGKASASTTTTSGSTTASSGTTSGGTTAGGSTSGTTTSGGTVASGGTTSGTTSGGTTSGGSTTTPPVVTVPPATTTPSAPIATVPISLAENDAIRLPQVGDRQLRVLTPTLLELQRITTKAKDPATVTDWNFVDASGNFSAPATSQFTVTVNGSTVAVQSVGLSSTLGS